MSKRANASFTYDASSPDFVPYADLTESVVLGWCWSEEGGVDQDAVEASLTANINEQKTPATESSRTVRHTQPHACLNVLMLRLQDS